MIEGGVTVRGLKEFRREVRKLSNAKEINTLLKQTHYEIAKSIIGPAQARAAGLGAMESRAASTLRASQAVSAAKLFYGGRAAVPWTMGAEFGAHQDRPRSRTTGRYQGFRQFNAWLGNGMTAGYFLYPTVRAEQARNIDRYARALDQITRAAFPN